MKMIFTIILAFTGLTSCVNNRNANPVITAATNPKEYVEVIYFHGKQRCITCNAIERLTKEVIEADFAQKVKDGEIVLKIVDISTREGEKIADQYEVTWSSLYINKWKEGEETRLNMTDFGFSYAKGSPDLFKEGVKSRIDELLK